MSLAAAFTAGRLAARASDRRFLATEAEITAAHERVTARRTALVTVAGAPSAPARAPRAYTERGRHAAPRPA
ncbi:hypothetical protein ESP57_17520 [Agromyces fucosus]|uniref:Uncharacterized protein n=1 Tax=Agromyces fucosus TaxID=41985 RepID=A0A4Q2JJH0_9MICO|nr:MULTISPECIES: hypothetical protein [Agromyces]KQZ07643.1 hypothetical protein ASD23_17675 [Agromyces sp. Root1464]RXZ46669.1 hypothetical protein ESP57_17520 [Agromyces fucosus]